MEHFFLPGRDSWLIVITQSLCVPFCWSSFVFLMHFFDSCIHFLLHLLVCCISLFVAFICFCISLFVAFGCLLYLSVNWTSQSMGFVFSGGAGIVWDKNQRRPPRECELLLTLGGHIRRNFLLITANKEWLQYFLWHKKHQLSVTLSRTHWERSKTISLETVTSSILHSLHGHLCFFEWLCWLKMHCQP